MERARIEKIPKALADATRLMIFEAISAKKEMICGELVALHGVTPATISHHLKILAEAGLIECRRQGNVSTTASSPKLLPSTPRLWRKWRAAKIRARPA